MSLMAGTSINMDQISAKNSIAAALKQAMLERTIKAMEEQLEKEQENDNQSTMDS